MRLSDQQLAEYLAFGERSSVEFKPSRLKSDARAFAQVARAVIGMANHRDGGTVIVGVEDVNNQPDPIGMDPAHLASWNENDVRDGLAEYADPFVSVDVQILEVAGKLFVVLNVDEFEEVPVICRRDFDGITKRGRLYVRPRGKARSVEIPSQTEMREVIELATLKAVRKFLGVAQRAGLIPAAAADADLFREQREPELK